PSFSSSSSFHSPVDSSSRVVECTGIMNNLFGTIVTYVDKLKQQYNQYSSPDQLKTQPSGIPLAVAVPSGPSSSSASNDQQYQTVPEIKDDSGKKAKTAKAPPEDDGQYINCAEMSQEELKKHLSK
ncbi:hypothetical protein PENTCL1PPCAC_6254, partial [Pristionchus entomophagus]